MILFTIVLMGAIVFLLRFSFFAVPRQWEMPALVARALPYVLPAVLMALLLPGVLLSDEGGMREPVIGPYFIGAAAGFAVAALRKDSFFLVFGGSVLAFATAKLVLAP